MSSSGSYRSGEYAITKSGDIDSFLDKRTCCMVSTDPHWQNRRSGAPAALDCLFLSVEIRRYHKPLRCPPLQVRSRGYDIADLGSINSFVESVTCCLISTGPQWPTQTSQRFRSVGLSVLIRSYSSFSHVRRSTGRLLRSTRHRFAFLKVSPFA